MVLPATEETLNDVGLAASSHHLTLGGSKIQKSIEAAVQGSRDGNNWELLIQFSPTFYCGPHLQQLDLSQRRDIKLVRAQYQVSSEKPMPREPGLRCS